jgi:thymidylate synthase
MIGQTSSATHDEQQYFDLVRRVISTGVTRTDRSGAVTKSVFGAMTRWNLTGHVVPLLTTKRVFWRGIVEELLWFIRGGTNAESLRSQGVHIWDAHGSRAHLDSCGLTDYPEYELGPIYGHQWRHWGASYPAAVSGTETQSPGIDQLSQCIHQIRTTPTSRRIVMTAWQPAQLSQMALPPCHILCQFFVNEKKLSCLVYQRSCDLALGVPFNLASYALLTHLIAHVTNLEAVELIHSMGDVHLYQSHVPLIGCQLSRTPYPFPTLQLDRQTFDIDSITAADIQLLNYVSHPKIEFPLVV